MQHAGDVLEKSRLLVLAGVIMKIKFGCSTVLYRI
jgi:hypothetical protein